MPGVREAPAATSASAAGPHDRGSTVNAPAAEIALLTERDRDDLIRAVLEPDDNCAHNMVPLFETVEQMIQQALCKAADVVARRGSFYVGSDGNYYPIMKTDEPFCEAANAVLACAYPPASTPEEGQS